MKRARAALLAVFCVLLFVREARADGSNTDSTAAQFFRAGLAAYERHEYRAAALAFEEAYHRLPRAAAIYNAGRCWEAAGDAALSADAFAVALAGQDLDEHDAEVARQRLAAIEPALGVVALDGPPTAVATIDGAERGSLPQAFHVPPGVHAVRVALRDGSRVERIVSVGAGARSTVVVAEEAPSPDRPVPSLPPAPPVTAPTHAFPPPRPGPVHPVPVRTMPRWGWFALGASAVLATLGGSFYVQFASDRSSFDAAFDHSAAFHATAENERAAAIVLWALAGAGGVAAGVGFLTSRSAARKIAVRVGPGWVTAVAFF